jgi:hypothetical protein
MEKSCSILFISLLLLAASCANVPDIRTCVEISPIEAKCVKMISGVKEDWNDDSILYSKTYWEYRNIMIRVHPEEIAKLKAFFLKYCRNKQCDQVQNAFENLESSYN